MPAQLGNYRAWESYLLRYLLRMTGLLGGDGEGMREMYTVRVCTIPLHDSCEFGKSPDFQQIPNMFTDPPKRRALQERRKRHTV